MSASLILAGLLLGAAAHLALFLAPRKLHPLFLVAGMFFVIAPTSLAGELALCRVAKYARVYCTVLIVLWGYFGFRVAKLGPASKALLGFALVYILAACWSDAALRGLLYKSFFGFAALAGLVLAHVVRHRRELVHGLRFISLVAALTGVVAFVYFIRNPGASTVQGRMAVFGMSANLVGVTAAPLLVFCAHLALYDREKKWRVVGYAVCGLMVVIIIHSGSRAALALAGFGGFAVALPMIRQPIKLAAVLLFAFVFLEVALSRIESPAADRITSFDTENRQSGWRRCWREFGKSPLVGRGWAYVPWRHTTANYHNMYLQTLVEVGMLGGAALGLAVVVIVLCGLKTFFLMRSYPEFANLTGLPLALAYGVLLHGIAESCTLMGTTLTTFCLGLGVGLIDRLPLLLADDIRRLRLIHAIRYRALLATSGAANAVPAGLTACLESPPGHVTPDTVHAFSAG